MKHYYTNADNYKYIKKINLHKLYFFTKKISNEFRDMKLITKFQKYYKKRFIDFEKNIISNFATNSARDLLEKKKNNLLIGHGNTII